MVWDTLMKSLPRTLLGAFWGSLSGEPFWGVFQGSLFEEPIWEVFLSTLSGEPFWGPFLGSLSGKPFWGPLLGSLPGEPFWGALLWSLLWEPFSGSFRLKSLSVLFFSFLIKSKVHKTVSIKFDSAPKKYKNIYLYIDIKHVWTCP